MTEPSFPTPQNNDRRPGAGSSPARPAGLERPDDRALRDRPPDARRPRGHARAERPVRPSLRRARDLWSRAADDAWLQALLAKDHVIALAATVGAEAVGGLVAYELDKFEQARREVYIYDLAVAAPHRRRGIATALIRAVQAIAAERGAWVVFVQADLGDATAVALYGKLGVREDLVQFDLPVAGDRAGTVGSGTFPRSQPGSGPAGS